MLKNRSPSEYALSSTEKRGKKDINVNPEKRTV